MPRLVGKPFFKYLCSPECRGLMGHWTESNGSVKVVIHVLITESGINFSSNSDIMGRCEMMLRKDDIT